MYRCALVLVVACVVAANPAVKVEETKDMVEGRSIASTMRDMWNYFFGDDDNDYDYDYAVPYDQNDLYRQDNNQVSSYSWYEPFPQRQFTVEEDDEETSWTDVFVNVAMFAAPVVALIALLPPAALTIGVKKRSFGEDNLLEKMDPMEAPLLRSLMESDLLSLTVPSCQKKIFCELSQIGKEDNAPTSYKILYYFSHLTPDKIARRFRVLPVFMAARENQCERFTCRSPFYDEGSPSNHLEAPKKDI